ncbi:MAG TPA: hypothetical protein VLD84_06040 [Nitrososphaeraceae archaeon]|nr:hypothetical protein [Nitrososphaeraceae archaeon]
MINVPPGSFSRFDEANHIFEIKYKNMAYLSYFEENLALVDLGQIGFDNILTINTTCTPLYTHGN